MLQTRLLSLQILIPVLWITGSATVKIVQRPHRITAVQGERVTLHCSLELENLAIGYLVPWTRELDGNRSEIPLPDPAHRFHRHLDSTSLVISAVEAKDSGRYFCQLWTVASGLQEGNGTQLTVLVPPSVPVLFLKVPSSQGPLQWSLLCETRGFYPPSVNLSWTQTRAGGVAEPIGSMCSWETTRSEVKRSHNLTTPLLPNRDLGSDVGRHPGQSLAQCLQVEKLGQLVSVLELPPQGSQSDDVTYTCTVSGHPALSTALSASYIQGE
ncbi:hypothetical protein ACEWY4_019581 [Coilia grayii]|uniref:Ig-like domain-containing protein n=1 Tax=Coilia grayii TaxID=363190 RepID=A0ABD1JDD1_9TELE